MKDGSKSLPSGSSGAAAAPARQTEPAQGADFLEDRVEELRRRYRAGTYKVDAARLSAKIIGKHVGK